MADLEDDIICPYCEYKFKDSWEYGQEDDQIDCGDCGNQFNLSVNVSISYSTSKISCEEREPKQDHVWLNDEARSVYVSQDDVIRLDLHATKPNHFLWMRQCQNCDDERFKETQKNINPFVDIKKS